MLIRQMKKITNFFPENKINAKALIIERLILVLWILIEISVTSMAQTFEAGWTGKDLIPINYFTDGSKWISRHSQGENCSVTTDAENVSLHWEFGTGNRAKWAICFQSLDQPVSLSDFEVIGIDVKGSNCNPARNFRLKLEDGTNQATFIWHGLASLDRWCQKLVVLKNQFSGNINWNNIKVITFEVSSDASANDTGADTGTVIIRKLVKDDITSWQRSDALEFLQQSEVLDSVKNQAIRGILKRQVPNGLFYTWNEDKSSWLYGHGILLKLLSIEGEWSNGQPANSCAKSAEKLALFLVNNQDAKGFWPRAWNTDDGSIRVYTESDGTIWMGDFPWPLTGLVNYFAKSRDDRVLNGINKASVFLFNLIDPNGKFYTINANTNTKYEVTSVEAYAAAIQSVYELGDSAKAVTMINYISSLTWDSDLKYWKEAIGSVRPVLFANTWMSQLMYLVDDLQKSKDALSFVGKALYTRGPGNPPGYDGIGPVATWYEGTINYICAHGPGSQALFDSVINYRLVDGTIPAYNDNIGGKVDIWAVDWSSLDATLWLYFAAANGSPYKSYYNTGKILGIKKPGLEPGIRVFPNPAKGKLSLENLNQNEPISNIRVYKETGALVLQIKAHQNQNNFELDLSSFSPGIYFVQCQINGYFTTRKIEILN
jgi:hypothetical protein